MKNLFKKNQIVLFVIGLMVIAAGYLNFTNNSSLETGALTDSEEMASIGDAKLVSGEAVNVNSIDVNSVIDNNANSDNSTNKINNDNNNVLDNNKKTVANQNTEAKNNELTVKNSNEDNTNDYSKNTVETNSQAITNDEYFTNSKLERDTMYSQRIENYQNILNNSNISETQKKTAQEEISKINNEQNAIMIAENLIKVKGIDDLIIFVNNDSINIIVKEKKLEKGEIAQIQNIVTRELNTSIENIHIMNK